ncbi:hypothetical protein K431DRAFT_282295 [Polychaeton citri CBS 116435]|uniref:GET complex, subunit GET2 n=1 Tax=Polychaeton citri CBS 116435 TaxID=1314669 RepID=A0A9P4QCS6_9PEZI|nr:hypothetical protein K431DRAFT_282295 [Polychaeton citri CBS 116435]
MAESVTATPPPPENETPTQRKARERREKRLAKFAEHGEDRLAKIKQLNGGVAPPAEVLGGPEPTETTKPMPTAKPAAVADDPDEVDISDGAFTPASRNFNNGTPAGRQAPASADPFREAMLQLQAQQSQQTQQEGGNPQEDPMVKMMQQLMGGMPGGQGQGQGGEQNIADDPMFKMMQTMMGGPSAQGTAKGATAPTDGRAYVWRVVHAIFAFSLAAFVALTSTFNGTQLSRTQDVYDSSHGSTAIGRNFFLIFATAELVLQTTRYFLEKGQLQGSGWIAKIANSGFVPEPYAGYVRTLGRYTTIYTTIVSDAMVVVFILGALAWWRGKAVA